MLKRLVSLVWGDLTGDELKKYALLACGAFCIIGSWWPLKTLKDSVFINMVGPAHLPEGKWASLALCFPLVLMYSRLVDKFSKEKLIYIFMTGYGIAGFFLMSFLTHPTIGLANQELAFGRLYAWIFYLFFESYISIALTLYWSFIHDISTPDSAKKGYGLIIFGTQLGGFLYTLLGRQLSQNTLLFAERARLIGYISVTTFFVVALIVYSIKHLVGADCMRGYVDTVEPVMGSKPETVGFLDGLKLLLTRWYVAGIFFLRLFQELVTTTLGFQLQHLAKATYVDAGLVTRFLFDFNLAVQTIALVFAFAGTSLFQRVLGIPLCLLAYPLGLGFCLIAYLQRGDITCLFYVMLAAKALNYAFNQPTKEALYIPTSRNIKYKSKAWIDMFGERFSKACGAWLFREFGFSFGLINGIALGIVTAWVALAASMGRLFARTVDEKRIIQ